MDNAINGQARFNSGVMTVTTIRGLMDRLHQTRNPYGVNMTKGYIEPNYMTFLETLNSLWAEIEPKAIKHYSEKEMESIIKAKNLCDMSMTYRKPFKQSMDGTNIPNHENIAKLVLVMSAFEKKIRLVIEKAGLSNPDFDEEGSL